MEGDKDNDFLNSNYGKRTKIKKPRKSSPQIKTDLSKDFFNNSYRTSTENSRYCKKEVLDNNKFNESINTSNKKKNLNAPSPNTKNEDQDTDENFYFYIPKATSQLNINLNDSLSVYCFPDEKLSPEKTINFNLLTDDSKYEEMLNKCKKYDFLLKKYKQLYKELSEIKTKYSSFTMSNNLSNSDLFTNSLSSIDLKCFGANTLSKKTDYHIKKQILFPEKFNDDTNATSLNVTERKTMSAKKKQKGKNLVKKELIKPEDGKTKITNIKNTIKRKIIVSQIKKLDIPPLKIEDVNKDLNTTTKYLRFSSRGKRVISKSSDDYKKSNKNFPNEQNNYLYKNDQFDRCTSESLSIIQPKKKIIAKKKKNKLKIEKIPSVNIKVKYCPKFKKCICVNEIFDFNILNDKQQKKESELEKINKNIKKKPKQKKQNIINRNRFNDVKIENYHMSIIDDESLINNKKSRKNICKTFDQNYVAIHTLSISIKNKKKVSTKKKIIIEEKMAPNKDKEFTKTIFIDNDDPNINSFPSDNEDNIENNKGNFTSKSTPKENSINEDKQKNTNENKNLENENEEIHDVHQTEDGKNIFKRKTKIKTSYYIKKNDKEVGNNIQKTNLNEKETIPNNNKNDNINNNKPKIDINKMATTNDPENDQNLYEKLPTDATHNEKGNEDENNENIENNDNNKEDENADNLGGFEEQRKLTKKRRKKKVIYITKEVYFCPNIGVGSFQFDKNNVTGENNPRKITRTYEEKYETYSEKNQRNNKNKAPSSSNNDNDDNFDKPISYQKSTSYSSGFRNQYNPNTFNNEKSKKSNSIEPCIKIQLIQNKIKKPMIIVKDINDVFIPNKENKNLTENQLRNKFINKKINNENKLLSFIKPLDNLCQKITELNVDKNYDDFVNKLKQKALISHLDNLDNKNKNKLLKDALDKLKLNNQLNIIIYYLKKYENNKLNIDNSNRIEIIGSVNLKDKYKSFINYLDNIDNKYKNKLKKYAFDKCKINNEINKLIDELKIYEDTELEIEYPTNINIIQEKLPLNKNKQFDLNELSIANQISKYEV